MFIRYRDRYGRFISKKSASRRKPKNVISEQVDRKIRRGKLQEKIVVRTKGYRIRRFGFRKPVRKIPKKPVKPFVRKRKIILREELVEEIAEEGIEEFLQEEIEEEREPKEFEPEPQYIGLAGEWSETLGEFAEMSGLDELDWIEDHLDEEDEWYEE